MPRLSILVVPVLLVACQACQAPTQAPEEPAAAAGSAPPAVTEGTVASADGVPIAYSVEGDGEVAVVLIHGWSCDRTYWRDQIEPLMASHKVVSLDLAGHGSSGVERAAWTLPSFGTDVRAVVEALGLEKVVLVGHSMGAPVALEAAPLLAGKVLGVVAVDALHDADNRPDPEQWQRRVESYESDFAGTCGQFVRSMFLDAADPDLVESTAMDMCAAPPEVAIPLIRVFGSYDTAAAMRAAGVPVRAINSGVYPTNVEGNRRYADFEARFIEGVAHFPMLIAPEELNRHLLEVLAELLPE